MAKVQYDGSEQFKPVSAWGYVGYTILFAIPVLGLIFLIVFACSGKKINRRNYARSYFCVLLLGILASIVLGVLVFFNVGSVKSSLITAIPQLEETINALPAQAPSDSTGTTRTQPESQITRAASTKTATVTEKPVEKATEAPSAASKDSGVRKDVKDAIDSYEKWFNDYAAFMKKYSKSSNQLAMLNDYTKMMSDYVSMVEKWDKFTDDYDLNDAELAYYTAAVARINKTLLSVY